MSIRVMTSSAITTPRVTPAHHVQTHNDIIHSHRRRYWSVLVSRPQDLTKLSVIPIERLLIYVQCQFRIIVVTQIEVYCWFCPNNFQFKKQHKAFGGRTPPEPAGEVAELPQIPYLDLESGVDLREKAGRGRKGPDFCKQIAATTHIIIIMFFILKKVDRRNNNNARNKTIISRKSENVSKIK